jgi:type I restriction enzyme S subunit
MAHAPRKRLIDDHQKQPSQPLHHDDYDRYHDDHHDAYDDEQSVAGVVRRPICRSLGEGGDSEEDWSMSDSSLLIEPLPLGWTNHRFGEACDRVKDSYQPVGDGDTPYIGLEHLVQGFPAFVGRGKESDVKSSKTAFKIGDILFGKLRPYLRKGAQVDFDGVCSTDILAFRAKSICDSTFLKFVIHSNEFVAHAKSTTSGVQHPRTSWPALREFRFSLPPLPEQRKIAGVLGLVQRTMEQQERLLALTAELKKALLHQLFTRGLRNEPQKQTEIGPNPQSWDVVELGVVADLVNGFAFKSGDYVDKGILNFRVVNIRDEGMIDVSNDFEFLPKEFERLHEQYLLREGDILVVMVGATRGKMAFIPKTVLPALMNQNMWRIVPKSDDEMNRRYLYHFLTTAVPVFVREFSESARGFFKKSDFRTIKVPKPKIDEQTEIAAAIDRAEQKLILHRRKHAALSALFRTLLHELMTARIRVQNLILPSE